MEEEGRLHDPVLRENFLTRVFAHAHWQALCQRGLSHSAIVAFHSRYKYQLLAHSPEHYRSLGRLLGEAGHYQPEALGTRYFGELMQGLLRDPRQPWQRVAAPERLPETRPRSRRQA